MSDMNIVHRINKNARYLILDTGMDLKLILSFALITLAFIYLPVLDETIIRSALGISMILFVPGYALIAALFPGKADIDGIERVALSFGMSIAVVPLIGLGLNFTPWGIRLYPIVICLTIFTIICAVVANVRRHLLMSEDCFSIDFKNAYESIKTELFADNNGLDKALTVLLIVSILLSIVMAAYVIAVPQQREKFTEFYILSPDGKADNYSTNYHLGDSKPIIVGVVNHEYGNVSYDLVVSLNDSIMDHSLYTEHIVVADNQTWEQRINVTPDRTGTNMKLEFLLYEDGNMAAPYRECNLWVNVWYNKAILYK